MMIRASEPPMKWRRSVHSVAFIASSPFENGR
jgi:hypothetical protein